jgi:hypothetical protein
MNSPSIALPVAIALKVVTFSAMQDIRINTQTELPAENAPVDEDGQ